MNKLIILTCCVLVVGCCNEDFIVPSTPNDNRINAIDVSALFDVPPCPSENPIYTTAGATADGGSGSCWSTVDNAGDVWFKFEGQPPYGYVSILVNVGGLEGSQTNSNLVLWDTDGVTQLDCASSTSPDDDLYLFYGNLTIGETYYFSVSVPDNNSKGTFSMCVTTSD